MLNLEVLINLLLDSLIFGFNIIVFFIAIKVIKFFNINENDNTQYKLILNSYLASTIIKIAFIVKIVLFFYFILTLDTLSALLTGAMCGAGVISANSYGVPLLTVKTIELYIFGYWLFLNYFDLKTIYFSYTKKKFMLFIFLFILLTIEIFLEYNYFFGIDIDKIVSCCGTLFNPYKTSNIGYLLQIPHNILLGLFFGIFLLMIIFRKKNYIFTIFNIIFLFISILAIILFFSPYIYELPTHRCPFCILQSDYYYIGYFIYIFLFLGTFFGVVGGLLQIVGIKKQYFKYSLIFNFLLVIVLEFFVISYYLKNGVFLF